MLVHAGDGRFIVTAWAIAYSMHPQLVVDSIAILGGLKLLLRCRSSSHHKVFNRGTVATLLVFSVSSIQVCADDGASRMQAMGAYCGISNRRAMCWLIDWHTCRLPWLPFFCQSRSHAIGNTGWGQWATSQAGRKAGGE
jgi:hypothetical protein